MISADRDELLFELVLSPYWGAVKGIADDMAKEYQVRLTSPAENLMGLVAKESDAARLQAVRNLIERVEHRARQHKKSTERA